MGSLLSAASWYVRLSLTEVGIVVAATVLSVGDNSIPATSTFAKVAHLEVSSELIKTESVDQVVVHIAGVEQLGDDKVNVLLRGQSIGLSVFVNKGEVAVHRSVVVKEVVSTFPVLVRDNVVTDSGVESGSVVLDLHTVDLLASPWVGRGRKLVPTGRRGGVVPWLCDDRGVTGRWIIDTPWENEVRVRLELLSWAWKRLLFATLGNVHLLLVTVVVPSKVGGPIDDPEQFTGLCVDICFVPAVLHLDLKLPDKARLLIASLSVHQSSGYVVDNASFGKTRPRDDFGSGLSWCCLGGKVVLWHGREVFWRQITVETFLRGNTGKEVEQSVDREEHFRRSRRALADRVVVLLNLLQVALDLCYLMLAKLRSVVDKAWQDDLCSGLDQTPSALLAGLRS